MIPNLVKLTDQHPYLVLPPGIHTASLDEIREIFACTPYRQILYEGFCLGYENLVAAGCKKVFLDGSFTTSKERPEDFDACWDAQGVNVSKLDLTLLDNSHRRIAQKRKYFGEFLMIRFTSPSAPTILDFFQRDRSTGKRKGILLVDNGSLIC